MGCAQDLTGSEGPEMDVMHRHHVWNGFQLSHQSCLVNVTWRLHHDGLDDEFERGFGRKEHEDTKQDCAQRVHIYPLAEN